jgi:hypothetical protein
MKQPWIVGHEKGEREREREREIKRETEREKESCLQIVDYVHV